MPTDDLERAREVLDQNISWSQAYPRDIFTEPTKEDWAEAHKLLKDGGQRGMDRFSADSMRHVIEKGKFGEMARALLAVVDMFEADDEDTKRAQVKAAIAEIGRES